MPCFADTISSLMRSRGYQISRMSDFISSVEMLRKLVWPSSPLDLFQLFTQIVIHHKAYGRQSPERPDSAFVGNVRSIRAGKEGRRYEGERSIGDRFGSSLRTNISFGVARSGLKFILALAPLLFWEESRDLVKRDVYHLHA